MSDDKDSTQGPDQPDDPMARWFAQFGFPGGGEFDLNQLISQLQRAMSQVGGGTDQSGINWAQAKAATRQVVATLGADPSVGPADQRQVAEADRLANLWLDANITFEAVGRPPAAWSRAEWVEHTMDSWRTIAEPVVTRIADALAESFGAQFTAGEQAPPELAQFGAMLTPLLRGSASSMYAMQLAQAIGKVAGEVVSGTEIGLQLLRDPQVVLLPTNVAAFGAGLGVADDDIRLYLTVREAARQRLFAHVGWLGPQLLALVEHYAREIVIDVSALTDAIDVDELSGMTPQRLNELSEQLQGRLFSPAQTPEQVEILGRLETLLALVEGWVDEVTATTIASWMPHAASQLTEAVRRRRAANNPTQQVFDTLVGMDLHPRRVRDAANLWAALTRDRGVAGRDAVWAHPDMMPTAQDLDDPLGMLSDQAGGEPADEMDAALAELLAEAERERRDESGEGPA